MAAGSVLRSEVAVVGAGPYGLSIAAHLQAADVPTVVFGKPMEFWRTMPRGMHLRSKWSASSLAAPGGRYSLDEYVQAVAVQPPIPIRLPFFVEYASWFQRQAVSDLQTTYVRSLNRADGNFELELQDGRACRARRVVVAVGIRECAYVPAFATCLLPELATHTQEHRDFKSYAGKRVAIVGGGQSALESAALLHESGALVEVIARRELVWLRLQSYRGPGARLLHAPSDVGPPGLNWLIHFSGAFRHLPTSLRAKIGRRATRPAGARWLHHRVVGSVTVTAPAEVRCAIPQAGSVRLMLSDGSERTVDHVLLGTGFRPHVDRVGFLTDPIRERLRHRHGFPALDGKFESSVPGLHFVGGLADRSYGPICRFVSGAGPTARRILTAVRDTSA